MGIDKIFTSPTPSLILINDSILHRFSFGEKEESHGLTKGSVSTSTVLLMHNNVDKLLVSIRALLPVSQRLNEDLNIKSFQNKSLIDRNSKAITKHSWTDFLKRFLFLFFLFIF